MAKKTYLIDGVRGEHYVRAWKNGRQWFVIQVWVRKTTADGEPDGDWDMPAPLGLEVCVEQAILQSRDKVHARTGKPK